MTYSALRRAILLRKALIPMSAPVTQSTEEAALLCLHDVFASLKSTRCPRGTRYPLPATLALIVVAVLSGCRNHTQIYVFAQARPQLLKRLGFRPPKYPKRRQNKDRIAAPNEDTLAAILASVPDEELNERFAQWLARMVVRGSQAAIDGKALRGAKEYVLSVFVNDLRQVVWQEAVGTKENELSCLERSLQTILARYPHLRLFTGDAAFCHKTIARQLVRARRDYFLQLKAPHTGDVALAEGSFAQLRSLPPTAQSVEKRGPSRPGNRDAPPVGGPCGRRLRPWLGGPRRGLGGPSPSGPYPYHT